MSFIVTVYVNEGIVMASDSRITLTNSSQNGNLVLQSSYPLSDSTFKTFLCPNGVGISTCGDASYLNKPIAGYLEQLIKSFKSDITVSEIPKIIVDYFNNLDIGKTTIFHVCGYETINGVMKQKVYYVNTGMNSNINDVNPNDLQGAFWNGETSVISKLFQKQLIAPKFEEVDNLSIMYGKNNVKTIEHSIVLDKKETTIYPEANIAWSLLSLQDAVDFAKFTIETTIKAMQFQSVSKTVGGPIDILIIKPNESKWLKHKKLIDR